MKRARHMARMGESRGAYRVLVGKSERKSTLGRTQRTKKGNIKLDIEEMRWGYKLDRSG
jgi:hypothetical protein